MKTIVTLLICSLFTLTSFSQVRKKKTVYLVVRIQADALRIEKGNDLGDDLESYFAIAADPESPYASDIYSLVPYKIKNKANPVNGVAKFSNSRNDSEKTYYNYFKNSTEALLFLSNKGWELLTVVNDINSSFSTAYNYPYTTINSQLVYYLKKEVDQ